MTFGEPFEDSGVVWRWSRRALIASHVFITQDGNTRRAGYLAPPQALNAYSQ